jgi:hypothetical protein
MNEDKEILETWKNILHHNRYKMMVISAEYEIYKIKQALINKEYRKIGDQHG